MDNTGNAGVEFCIYRGSQKILRNRIPLGNKTEVYNAEIIVAISGLRAACSHIVTQFATHLFVFLDNQDAALHLQSGLLTSSSSKHIIEFQRLKELWLNRHLSTAAKVGTV